MKNSRGAWLLPLIASVSCAAPAAEHVDEDPGTEVLALGSYHTLRGLTIHGGGGGSTAPTLNEAIIYGMHTTSARLIDSIAFAYYQVPPGSPDNHPSNSILTSVYGPYGGNGGASNGWQYCPAGYAANGIQGAAGDRIDRIGLICIRLDPPHDRVYLPAHGGRGGTQFHDTCDPDELMARVWLRTGRVVDAIQIACQKMR